MTFRRAILRSAPTTDTRVGLMGQRTEHRKEAEEMSDAPAENVSKIVKVLKDFISDIPSTSQSKSDDPVSRSRSLGNSAAAKAAVVSGSLSIPPGPFGMVTIIPDLVAVWKIQAQMVADIAGAFGKAATLTREQMIYCLFKHAASQAVRDLVVRVGGRVLVKRASLRLIQKILQKIGLKITQRLAGRFISRWLPVIGAVGVGAYSFYDTAQVAKTSIEFFKHDIDVE